MLVNQFTIAAATSPLSRVTQVIQKPLNQLLRIQSKRSSSFFSRIDAIDDSKAQMNAESSIPDFNNARATFEGKSTTELFRAAACLEICKIPLIVENAGKVLSISRHILGSRFVDAVLKATFYGHFCAGEDQERIRPVIQKLRDAGVGSILDYAAENDAPIQAINCVQPKLGLSARGVVTAREYDYESEAQCDQHVSTFLQCINDVNTDNRGGEDIRYAAIKVTALGNPKLLARLSTAIVEAKRLFSIFDMDDDGLISRDEFEFGYKYVTGCLPEPECER